MPRIQVAAQEAPGHDPSTDHLRLVMEPLLAQGNRTAYWWHADGWRSDPGGELQYAFIAPIDAAELRERFSFPVSIQVREGGFIKDRPNRVAIYHERPA
jgi:hypothetical protein